MIVSSKRVNAVRGIAFGVLGAIVLLSVYVSVLVFVSGWEYMLEQFATFWYFIVSLAVGFGIQIGLYTYLRRSVRQSQMSGRMVAVSGTASTTAMISCCAHYLVNILPILGATGLVAIVAQYQISLFWIGLLANVLGIVYIGSKVVNFERSHE